MADLEERITRVMEALLRHYRKKYNAELSHYMGEPYKVIIATILSQRTRDEVTHRVAQRLFQRYPTVEALASADEDEVIEIIKGVGFYRQKAKKIISTARIIVEKYGGRVPDNIDELLSLPGVGRKTANCVLVYGYGIPAIAVDTHVHRLTNMWGWVHTRGPDETEKELEKILPHKYWLYINDLLITFGRDICRPQRHRCDVCLSEIKEQCPVCCQPPLYKPER